MSRPPRRNPNWSRDETLLALDLYLRHRPKLLDDDHPDVVRLSETLLRLARARGVEGTESFRNANGVAMKLGNLSSNDPQSPPGRKGLAQGAKGIEAAVWRDFSGDQNQLAAEVARILQEADSSAQTAFEFAEDGAAQRVFVTGMWGFVPGRDGYVGFTHQSIRDRFIAEHQAGDLMLVVGQKGEFSETRDIGRVLGLVELAPIAIHESERLSPDNYREKVARHTAERWQYGLPIVRAWEMASAIKAKFMAPETCRADNARVIGGNYLQLTPDEVGNVFAAKTRAVPAYGADEWNALIEDGDASEPFRPFSRGPPPAFGSFSMERTDGPTSVYVMCLDGCDEALFPQLKLRENDHRIIKVGLTNAPERRLKELNYGFPAGAAACWSILRTKEHPSGAEAHKAERRLLEYLESRKLTIGDEFAHVPAGQLDGMLAAFIDHNAGYTVAPAPKRRR